MKNTDLSNQKKSGDSSSQRKSQNRFSLRKLTVLSLMTALSLMIFFVESLLPSPVPIPGIKLGLSNIISLILLNRYGAREALPVLLCRILLSCFFFSQAISLAYSLTGGLLCLITMAFLQFLLQRRYLWLTSIFGAIAHNIGQMAVALVLTRVPGVMIYLPFLLISAAVTGLFTGLCAHFALQRLPKFPD